MNEREIRLCLEGTLSEVSAIATSLVFGNRDGRVMTAEAFSAKCDALAAELARASHYRVMLQPILDSKH